MRFREIRMQWRIVVALVVSTSVLVIDHYQHIFDYHVFDRLLLCLGIPLLLVVAVFRESPAKYGFQWGDWKAGLALTIGACGGIMLVSAIIQWPQDFQIYYAYFSELPVPVALHVALDFFGWEFFFRGFLLFSLLPVCGPYALLLQAVPFALAHLEKPELETLSCIFGGTAFGYVAWRTRSFYYPFLIHWYLGTVVLSLASRGTS